jgi:hypothetical protein
MRCGAAPTILEFLQIGRFFLGLALGQLVGQLEKPNKSKSKNKKKPNTNRTKLKFFESRATTCRRPHRTPVQVDRLDDLFAARARRVNVFFADEATFHERRGVHGADAIVAGAVGRSVGRSVPPRPSTARRQNCDPTQMLAALIRPNVACTKRKKPQTTPQTNKLTASFVGVVGSICRASQNAELP